jgi:hypothetical protein
MKPISREVSSTPLAVLKPLKRIKEAIKVALDTSGGINKAVSYKRYQVVNSR